MRVLMCESPSVSRMREIRTSGLMRGEDRNCVPPLLDCFNLGNRGRLGWDNGRLQARASCWLNQSASSFV